MEALLLIIGEMVFALLVPLVAVVVDFAGAILAFLFSFLPSRWRGWRRSSGLARKLLIVLLAIAVIIVGGLFLANKFYFAESVKMVFGALEGRAGIETECAEIGGSVFSGRITLGECKIDRTGHASSDFQLELDSVEFDLQLSSLFGTAVIQTAHISGLRGSVSRKQIQEDIEDDIAEKPRRAFVIQDLRIEGVAIRLSGFNKDGGEFELPIHVTSATSSPLRSRLALFDILFRSNASGDIAGAEFEIETGADSEGRQTFWRATDVPVADLGAVAGGVLSWFHGGVVDVYVEDKWHRDGQLEIDMDWRLGFRDVAVHAPTTAGVLTRVATGPIVDYVNGHEGNFPFEFQMVVNESQFEHKSSLAAAGLWTAVGESINSLLAEFGIDVSGSASETSEELKDQTKSVLDRLRKPKDNDE